MEDVVNFNARRADEAGDCQLMTVQDILEETLRQSRDGRWDKCVLLMYRHDDNEFHIDSKFAGCTTLEARGILFTGIKSEILD